MITSSSISYISEILEKPDNITDADTESINNLKEAFPYFVPARYLDAANKHKIQPFSNDMMEEMKLYQGNWLLYNEFLHNALGGEEVDSETEIEKTQAIRNISAEAAAEVEEEIIEEKEPVVEEQQEKEPVVEDDFRPENTGFVTGEAPTEEKETPIVEEKEESAIKEEFKEDVIEEKVEEIIVKEEPIEEKPVVKEETVAEEPVEEDTKDENLIPPVYTEDYFLHQGMQVSNNIPTEMGSSPELDLTDDEKSLMVVMSFSEWLSYYKKKKRAEEEQQNDQKELKSMWQREKLAAALEEENDEIPENVFEMAVNSITKEETLVSESLAEVLVKQGRHDKAIEMYKKLSLRKPQKKAYFARKIEEILKEK